MKKIIQALTVAILFNAQMNALSVKGALSALALAGSVSAGGSDPCQSYCNAKEAMVRFVESVPLNGSYLKKIDEAFLLNPTQETLQDRQDAFCQAYPAMKSASDIAYEKGIVDAGLRDLFFGVSAVIGFVGGWNLKSIAAGCASKCGSK